MSARYFETSLPANIADAALMASSWATHGFVRGRTLQMRAPTASQLFGLRTRGRAGRRGNTRSREPQAARATAAPTPLLCI